MSKRNSIQPCKRIALVIEPMTAPRRAMMKGVARYVQEHEPWSIYLKPPFVESMLGQWLETWRGDGVIGTVMPEAAEALFRAGVPFVDTAGYSEHPDAYTVHADDKAIGRIGAEHFLERGFKQFAFCEIVDAFWSRHRFEGFRDRLSEAGFSTHHYIVRKPSARPGGPDDWDKYQQSMVDWIERLPKPVGIMATTDYVGREILEACQRGNIRVPDPVAVIGADNDEPICQIATPPLSSVIIDDDGRGYAAAAILADLMDGEKPPEKSVLVSPAGVATRASTDVMMIDDDLVVEAMRYIRSNWHQPTGIEGIANALNVSQSTLRRRFRRKIGRSLVEEVVRIRVNNAIRFLSETKLPLKTIADRCGFSTQAYMNNVFRAKLGRTPKSYRH